MLKFKNSCKCFNVCLTQLKDISGRKPSFTARTKANPSEIHKIQRRNFNVTSRHSRGFIFSYFFVICCNFKPNVYVFDIVSCSKLKRKIACWKKKLNEKKNSITSTTNWTVNWRAKSNPTLRLSTRKKI